MSEAMTRWMGPIQRGMFRCRKLLDDAKGKRCQNCGAADGTVVCAHSDEQGHGRGKDNPSHDCFTAWLCVRCHSWYDAGRGSDPTGVYDDTRDDKRLMFRGAMDRTTLERWRLGLVRTA